MKSVKSDKQINRDNIRQLFEAGDSIEGIARAEGIGVERLSRILVELGLSVTDRKLARAAAPKPSPSGTRRPTFRAPSNEEETSVRQMFEDGVTVVKMASRLFVPKSWVERWLKDFGLSASSRNLNGSEHRQKRKK